MNQRVSIAIQTHPARAEMAATLNGCLGGRADLVFDPEPDDSLKSPWRTYRHALAGTPPDATHRLILQDDILVAAHFLEAVEISVRQRPDRLLLFFVPGSSHSLYREQMNAACRDGIPWVELNVRGWVPVIAVCWPVGLIEPLFRFDAARREAKVWPAGFVADDEIVGRFLRETGQEMPVACVPSIVEHPDTVPSIMNGHRNVGNGLDPGRQAAVWIGDYGCYGCDARRVVRG